MSVTRRRYTAIALGVLAVCCGGSSPPEPLPTPTPRPLTDAPIARVGHVAVWTGSRMIVWGGGGLGGRILTDGGLYDPVTNTWTATSATSAPEPRTYPTAAWIGTKMFVWGGYSEKPRLPDEELQSLFDGGLYDPVADRWTSVSIREPAPRWHASGALWTGSKVFVWGSTAVNDPVTGLTTGYRSESRVYDPASDTWTSVRMDDIDVGAVGVWTGQSAILWNGLAKEGWIYSPDADRWTSIKQGGPPAINEQAWGWAASRLVVWGGRLPYGKTNAGGRYDPAADVWSATSRTRAPSARTGATGVSTGSRLLVWGGWREFVPGASSLVADGGIYDPASDTWEAMSTAGQPAGRERHTAVWTGSRMIVWGGSADGGLTNTGGVYDPAADQWTPTATTRPGSP